MTPSAKHAALKSFIKSVQSKPGKSECTRCCTCCAKGGPALHLEDKHLIDSGALHGRFLFTIRQGEPAEDNVKGGLIFADSDIIKIKSKENAETCLYADIPNSGCSIYDHRPLECRVLKCWDTAEIETLYARNRLSRKDIIGTVEGLWDLVEEHQEKCSFAVIRQLVESHQAKLEGDVLEQILEMVQYDISLRALVIEKTSTDRNLLPFLFGTPLQRILGKLGIEFKKRTDLT